MCTYISYLDHVQYVHWGEFVAHAVDMRGEVALISRKIVIQVRVIPCRCPSID